VLITVLCGFVRVLPENFWFHKPFYISQYNTRLFKKKIVIEQLLFYRYVVSIALLQVFVCYVVHLCCL
jgi:hypothetical protein